MVGSVELLLYIFQTSRLQGQDERESAFFCLGMSCIPDKCLLIRPDARKCGGSRCLSVPGPAYNQLQCKIKRAII